MKLRYFVDLKIVLTLILLFGLSSTLSAVQDRRQDKRNIQYHYRISRLPTMYPDSTLLKFDFTVPYADLIFVKRDIDYYAGLKFNLFVTDKDNNTVFEQGWDNGIIVDSYNDTQNDTSVHEFFTSTMIHAGEYRVVVEAIDANIGNSEFNEVKIKINNHTGKKLVVGDILLYNGIYDFAKQDFSLLTPSPTNYCREDFTLLSEIYFFDEIDPDIKAEVIWYKNNAKILSEPAKITQNGNFLILFNPYSIQDVEQGRIDVQYRISGKNFKTKVTELQIEVIKQVEYYNDDSIDLAIEQMNYIGEGALWDSLKNAIDLDDKKMWFNRYWQENYAISDSTRNPIQEEYFRRVRYSNRKFYDGSEGWRTDRGRIYILYGPPNSIERSTDDMMRKYEIWTYQNLDRRYVFAETSGGGTFRLLRVH